MGRNLLIFILLLITSIIAKFYAEVTWSRILLTDLLILSLINYKLTKVILLTLPRDLKGIVTLAKVQFHLKRNLRRNTTVGSEFARLASKYGKKRNAFVDADTNRQWTFEESNEFCNRVATYFAKEGYRKGDVVALYMTNCPEYVCIWVGLSKLGVVTALINFNLKQEPLGHSINVSNAKSIIVGADLLPTLSEAVQAGNVEKKGMPIYVYGNTNLPFPTNNPAIEDFDQILQKSDTSEPEVQERPGFRDNLVYIYTSGTTGLPKAAIITHARYIMMGSGVHITFRIKNNDRIYITMPLYHTAAGILGAAQTLMHGCTCVVRRKFSASRFWEDCINFNCTASQYIGEICRYLLAQPAKPTDTTHKIRIMYGNGLRPQIWQQFVDRFGIEQIGEFYGSTEGNASLLNLDNRVGACGFLPIYPFIRAIYPVCLLKVDPDSGELIRDKNGLCVLCRPGESGEIVGRIIKGDPMKEFDGYVTASDSKKKLIQDVFKKGDAAFASGDILYMDERGYLYFRDRTGDTFRWKGENVSTTEVEGVIHKAVGMNDATVYGVEIPNLEGKAGMAAIVDENQNVDLEKLQKVLKEKLPNYAIPVFLRLCKQMDKTGTFKLKKTDLQKGGYDPTRVNGDRLFYLNTKTTKYEPLSADIHAQILKGTVSF